VFKKENMPLDQRMVQTKTTLHTQKSCDLGLSELNDCKICLRLGGPLFCECRNLHPISARSNTRSRLGQRLSITLGDLATEDAFKDLKFIGALSQSIGFTV